MSRFSALLVGAAAATLAGLAAASAGEDLDGRVARRLAAMSFRDKVAQLAVTCNSTSFDPQTVASGAFGNVMNFGYVDAETDAVMAAWRRSGNSLQMLAGIDMEYGFRTLFPVPIAQAATFDLGLNRRAAQLAAEEAVAAGVNWTFGPMMDVSRDQRWGRAIEGAGEDVLVESCMAGARTRGAKAGGQLVSLKHYAAHGFPEGGREYGPVEMGEPFLRDVVLPPFRTAIAVGADMVMAAFNSFNGVPVAANRRLLGEVLRGDLGFEGPVVSDWNAISQIARHGLDADPVSIAALSLRSGVDLDMAADYYQRHLGEALQRGLISAADVDAAAARVVRMKLAAGFDRPSSFDPAKRAARWAELRPEIRRVAIEIARRGDVLLQNHDDLLPLSGRRRIAVVGGLADDAPTMMGIGPAHARPDDVVTLRRAIEERATRGGIATDWIEACPGSCIDARPDDPAIAAAAARAAAADVAIVVIGERREETGEASSRADLRPAPGQTALVKAVAATGKPVVVVLLGGRAQIVEEFREAVGAILMAWVPGTFGAIGTAEILFGDVAPSGRLPFTWPVTTGQEPLSYDMTPTARPADAIDHWTNRYVDLPPAPRWPFGFGLTTSTVVYGTPRIDTPEVRIGDTVAVKVALTNTGRRAVREVAQAYVRDLVASRTRPVRRLAAFAAVALEPGETREVSFALRPAELGFHVESGRWIVEPGDFRVFVGGDATATASVDFRLLDGLDVAPRDEPVLCLDRVKTE